MARRNYGKEHLSGLHESNMMGHQSMCAPCCWGAVVNKPVSEETLLFREHVNKEHPNSDVKNCHSCACEHLKNEHIAKDHPKVDERGVVTTTFAGEPYTQLCTDCMKEKFPLPNENREV
jgi:hypothetical protein